MSRAFIKEDAGDDEVPERRPPSGPNYVTPRGLELLVEKARLLKDRRAELSKEERRDLRYWQARRDSAVPVDNSKRPPDDVRFGALVSLRTGAGTRRVRIVGQDEAEEGGEKVSWDSIPARVLTGHKVGERVELETGEAELTAIAYP